MNKDPDTNKPDLPEPTPEVDRLLKILEIQSAATRQRFHPSPLHSNSFRYGALVAIVVIAFGSLGVLEWFLSQLPKPAHPAAPGNSPTPAPSASISSYKYHI